MEAMKRNLLLILLNITLYVGSAQELTLPTYTQYLADSPFVISPTYAGIGDHIKIRANGIAQWVGIKDAPQTQSLALDARISERSGAGFLVYNDKNGRTKQFGARVSFAHHLTLDRYDDHYLSFGMSYIYNRFRVDVSELEDINDPAITGDRRTANHNFDVGVLWRYKKFWLSANYGNILDKDKDQFGINEPGTIGNMYLYSGYRYRKSKRSSFEIEPSAFMQWFVSDGRSITDFNVKFRWLDFLDYYWVGMSYRFLNDQIGDPLNVGPIIGLKKNNIYFAYSYQVILNEIIGYNSGTHMITFGIDIFQGLSNCRCMY